VPNIKKVVSCTFQLFIAILFFTLVLPHVAQAQGVPRIHPNDSHRFTRDGGATVWYPNGYYGAIGSMNKDTLDYNTYYRTLIDSFSTNGINFFRTVFTMGQPYGNARNPYLRTGPGNAADGRLKFDLTRFDQAYFDRWLDIVTYANSKGIVIQICILDAWHNKANIVEDNSSQGAYYVWGMSRDYYHNSNNIQGLSVYTANDWANPSNGVNAYQQALIRKLVDTVGHMPNIVWEIANEAMGRDTWANGLANVLSNYETSKSFSRHLVMPRDLRVHENIVGPDTHCDDYNNPSGVPGIIHSAFVNGFSQYSSPLISDNDCNGQTISPDLRRQKAWALLTAGAHINYFHFRLNTLGGTDGLGSADANNGMRYIGYLEKFLIANRVNLVGMRPSDGLVTNGRWAYARSGDEYIIYFRAGGSTTVSNLPSSYTAIWYNPRGNTSQPAAAGSATFTTPDNNDWVLYIKRGATPTTLGSPRNVQVR
jgi:hypothetical protein